MDLDTFQHEGGIDAYYKKYVLFYTVLQDNSEL